MTKDEALKKAFKQAFQLGQDYWYQADHEYVSQNKKSDVTRAKFEQLMEDAIKEALMSDTDGAQPEQGFTYEQMKEHTEGLQRDYDLLLAEYNLLKQDLITVADIEKIIKFKERNK